MSDYVFATAHVGVGFGLSRPMLNAAPEWNDRFGLIAVVHGSDADFRFGSRLCENAAEPKFTRI